MTLSVSPHAAAPEHSRGAFLLDDPSRAWRVTEGCADLFLVELRPDADPGPRRHIVRLGESSCIFGVRSADRSSARVLLVPLTGCRLRSLPPSDVDGRALENWVEALTLAASGAMPARKTLALEPGCELKVEEAGQQAQPRQALVWVRLTRGTARFLDDPASPGLGPGSWFPVCRRGWIEVSEDTHLSVNGTERWRSEDPELDGLQAFHRLVLPCLERKRRQADEQEKIRLRNRSSELAAVVDRSLGTLAGAAVPDQTEDAVEHPLLLACQAAGARQGIALKAPPGGAELTLAAIAQASHVRTRMVMLRGNWYHRHGHPLLAFRESDRRPLALLPRAAGYSAFDPVEKRTLPVGEALALQLEAEAFEFHRPFPRTRLGPRELLLFGVRGSGRDLAMVAWLGVAAGLLGTVTPMLTGRVFDSIIPGAQRSQLLQVTLFSLASAFAAAMLSISRGIAVNRVENRIFTAFQSALWDRLLSLPLPFFRDYSSGDLAARGLGINQVWEALTGTAVASILSAIFSVFSFALLFYYSVPLALLATALVGIVVTFTAICGYFQLTYQRREAATRGYLAGLVLQFLNGIVKLRVSGTESRAFSGWARHFSAMQSQASKASAFGRMVTVFTASFPVISSAILFQFAAGTGAPGAALTTGEFLAFNAAYAQFLAGALGLSAGVLSVLAAVPAYERAKPIFEAIPEVQAGSAEPAPLTGNIEVNNLSFRYRADSPLVLDRLSLQVKAGQFVAFVGPSGCGKSTLMRLLLGFEKPDSGSIYFDGQDLSGLQVDGVRRQIGTVLQSGSLMNGDLFRNIIGETALTMDDAWEAARLAGLDEDIHAMPMGMHTVLSEGGGGLSGGQRQRLMIARAIVHKPRILLFDEATSALDNRTQAIVTRSLDRFQATRIVIAHRLSTVIKADRIFVLNRGAVVEAGNFEELMAKGGMFAAMAQRQLA